MPKFVRRSLVVSAAPAKVLPAEVVPEEDLVDVGAGRLLTHHQTIIKFILLKMEMKCFSIRVA
jgi:hypothetical protein